MTAEAKEHTEQFLQCAMDKHQSQLKRELSFKSRELEKAQKRLADLDKLSRKAFELLALGNLSEAQFKALTGKLEEEISSGKDTMLNAGRFIAVVDKYTDIQALTPEIVREFIEKIVVHERSDRWKKKNYTQQVDVYFSFLGRV